MTLTALDRCCADAKGSCAASVMVQLTEESEPLLFCSHHYNKAEAALLALSPFSIIDTRDDAPVNRQQGESYS